MEKHVSRGARPGVAASRPTPAPAARCKEFHGKPFLNERVPGRGRIQANPRSSCQMQGIPLKSMSQGARARAWPRPRQPPLQLPDARNSMEKHVSTSARPGVAASRPTPVPAARYKEFHKKACLKGRAPGRGRIQANPRSSCQIQGILWKSMSQGARARAWPHPGQSPLQLPDARNSIEKHVSRGACPGVAASRPTPAPAARCKELHGKACLKGRAPGRGRVQANPRSSCQMQGIPWKTISQRARARAWPHPSQPPLQLPDTKNSIEKHVSRGARPGVAASTPTPAPAARCKEFHGKACLNERAPGRGRIQANPRSSCQIQGIPWKSMSQGARARAWPHPGQPPFQLPDTRNSMEKHVSKGARPGVAASRPIPAPAARCKGFH